MNEPPLTEAERELIRALVRVELERWTREPQEQLERVAPVDMVAE